eukprot:6165265-Pyramimonas_sp.AAC.1
MERGIVHCVQWCDTRDVTADGNTIRSIDRDMLLHVMGGTPCFKHDLKPHAPYMTGQITSSEPPEE